MSLYDDEDMETLSGVAWFTDRSHSAKNKPYEDRTVTLTNRALLVAGAGPDHLFALMDGIGGTRDRATT
jgi:hypothetical protein